MAYNYIRRSYGVDPQIGQRITMDGKPGTIIRPAGDPQYLNVRFDGQRHGSPVHPTWRVDYAPPTFGVARMAIGLKQVELADDSRF